MKCPNCDGRGKTTEYDGLRKFWCDYKCEYCNGTGEVEMTNEQWLKQCTTEQLAEWIADKSNEIISWIICEVIENECDVDEDDYWQKKSDVVEWLKEKHNG